MTKVLGLMSGTSLDGLDVALCEFGEGYRILKAQTFCYPSDLQHRLEAAGQLSGLELMRLDRDWADFAANCIKEYDFEGFELLASHGHTVFHKPHEGLTFQLGNGAVLAAKLGVPVVCDFRRTDVALQGQGAPLVPGAEIDLFSQFDACLNLGGIANITILNTKQAFDICPCNLVLNYYAQKMGMKYDKDGNTARSGTINYSIIKQWSDWSYYQKTAPKSLGKEDLGIFFSQNDPQDMLATAVEHIAAQISLYLYGKTLITGGGVYNHFLIDKIRQKAKNAQIVVPDRLLIEFKEALCFAYLGWLRYEDKNNVFSCFTGASKDSLCGAVYK